MKTLNMCIGREETQSEWHKGLMFRIYKEFIKIRKMWGSVRALIKEDVQMTKENENVFTFMFYQGKAH